MRSGCLVGVHNEWDPLEEIVVGTAHGARIPVGDRSLLAIELPGYGSVENIPSGPLPDWLVEETEAELERLCEELRKLDVIVRRPEPRNLGAVVATPDWQSDGLYDYCPRDILLTIGTTIIETPMVLRSRFLEPLAYKRLLLEYFESGARWISAPKPRLCDNMYDPAAPVGRRLQDHEPAFDAANVLRCGTDILYLVSDSGNEKGWKWLQRALGDAYTVHPCRGIYASTHVDSTIVPLRPGLVLLNPDRVHDGNLPEPLRGWDRIYAPPMTDTGFVGAHPRASEWIGMNLLVVRPDLVVVDDRQPALIRLLERHGVDVIPLRLTHARTLGGGFHCVSLDVRRRGSLETYR
jgi:glycine amidinotransferase/scyllo-inosamine-4-phosphate amidinotransferase 1